MSKFSELLAAQNEAEQEYDGEEYDGEEGEYDAEYDQEEQ